MLKNETFSLIYLCQVIIKLYCIYLFLVFLQGTECKLNIENTVKFVSVYSFKFEYSLPVLYAFKNIKEDVVDLENARVNIH